KQWQGIVPYMGMAVTELMGLGMFDFSDFQTLSFWMQGPAFNHLYERAKGGQGLAGVDLPKLGPLGGAAPTPGQTARYLTRSIPVGGVALERGRRALIMS